MHKIIQSGPKKDWVLIHLQSGLAAPINYLRLFSETPIPWPRLIRRADLRWLNY